MSTVSEKEFAKIFDIYYEDICRFLNYYTRDQYVIEEVVQTVFVKLWQERETHPVRYIKTYLYTSARNQLLNVFRNEKNREQLLSRWAQNELQSRDEHDCIDRDHFLKVLQCAVELLPDRCRKTFRLRYEEELSYREIADRQRVSVKTVENQLNAALKRIREYILSHPTHSALLLFFLKQAG